MLKIAWSPIYKYELPEGHRFPMLKYELLPEQLLYEGTVTNNNFFHPGPLSEPVALRTHTKEYWDKLTTVSLSDREIRAIGFPINEKFVERGRHISNGTVRCAQYALQHGCALNVAGGTHHAFADRGEGFCCFNDQAVAANYLLDHGLAQRILIVDLDVHQGNGTAHIFRNEPRVFTFSMHGERNYPLRKETSDLDIGLPDGMEDGPYLKTLREALPRLADRVQPDFIFYQSGVDVLASDKLGRLHLSREGCRERDRIVLSFCKTNHIPVAVSMGGGYSPRITDIVEAHANTFRTAQEIFF
ncbi:MAG: histone deacetylase [Saprospiraceae bacterium]|nr:histone deacetylase [Saprospiraceae bacterium]